MVQSALLVPAKTFTVYGSVESSRGIDWLHLVVTTSSACDVSKTNIRICYEPTECEDLGIMISFNCRFAFRSNIGTGPFFVYARDHLCPPNGSQSTVIELSSVAGNDEYYDVGLLEITI